MTQNIIRRVIRDCTVSDVELVLADVTLIYLCLPSYNSLSYDVASGSEITPCNKICKPLVVYRFTGNVITSITTLRT